MTSKPATRKVHGQPSWRIASRDVEAFVTQQGGQLAPVTFDRRGRKIRPYQVAPWANEKVDPSVPTIVRVLRGDFFCMPFGGNDKPYRGEQHPVHGETANETWKLESLETSADRTCLHLSLRTKVRKAKVDKRITLIDGHNALYCQHIVSDASGPMSFGHHATLKFPDEPGSGVISTSPFKLGQTFIDPVENPADRGYSILEPGAPFKRLDRVPTITGETADLSRYPARRGFEDLVQILSDPERDMAWTAVTFAKERYVWFALKDPGVLPGTIFWISNGGRHYEPWNGRHTGVMGLEEVRSYFHIGLSESAKRNPFSAEGYPTTIRLNPKRPLVVNYIMAVALVPRGFDRVKRINLNDGTATLTADNGKRVQVPMDGTFLESGA